MAQDSIGNYRLVVIGGSAGSLDIVMKIVAALPLQMRATVVVVLHRKNALDSALVNIFSSRTRLPVKEVEDKEALLPAAIYIAPPDYHLLIEDEHSFSLDSSEKIHYSRPSIDVTFESAAEIFGNAVVGILLSGANADGAGGLHRIGEYGGYTIVQDPHSADVGFMPQQAINIGNVDAVVSGSELPLFVQRLLLH